MKECESEFQLLYLSTEKNAQGKSCEVKFFGGKLKTITWETVSQVALRNCSEELRRKPGYSVFAGKKM